MVNSPTSSREDKDQKNQKKKNLVLAHNLKKFPKKDIDYSTHVPKGRN